MKRGLLLLAHGARDLRWAAPFEGVASRIRGQLPELALELGFLELMSPSLVEAGQRLVAAGCQRVDVLPLFLGTGSHVRKDLPVLMADLQTLDPNVQWWLLPAIGEVETVIAAMAAAAIELLKNLSEDDGIRVFPH